MNTTRTVTKNFNDTDFERTVRRMRTWLYSIARKRRSGIVTADDVHTYLDRIGVTKRQVRTRLRFINSMFSSGNFVAVGNSPSRRPAARGRMITEWTTWV
jgi:hypothetical protein